MKVERADVMCTVEHNVLTCHEKGSWTGQSAEGCDKMLEQRRLIEAQQ